MIIISKHFLSILKYNNKILKLKNHVIIIEGKQKSCILDYIFKEPLLSNSA